METGYSRTAARIKRRGHQVQLGLDVPLLLATITLTIFGLVMVFSASWDFSYIIHDSNTYMFGRQALFAVLGILSAVIAYFLDYHHWRRLALPMMAVTVLALGAVFLVNEVRYGAARTLTEGSLMPSEAAKLVTIIYLSVWLYAKRNQINQIGFGLFPLGVIIGIMGGLILAQPDISAVITLVFLGGILFFLAGGELRQIFILLMIVILMGWVIVQVQPTAKQRVADYYNGLQDPTSASYHVQRSIEAFSRGGFFGVGIGNAQTKLTGLPVPPTDSVFAVVAEETGVLGTSVLLGLYVLVALRGMKVSREAPDMLGSLLAAGLTFWIILEALINMAMMVGLLPFAGNALPFISLGGSNLVVTLFSIGIIMNISRLSKSPEAVNERNQHAFDGVSRSNRRRDQSRAGRAAGIRG
jgi:cell division protein FtsW